MKSTERSQREMSLTPAHVARVHRDMKDEGQPPGLQPQTDEDYAAVIVEDILSDCVKFKRGNDLIIPQHCHLITGRRA